MARFTFEFKGVSITYKKDEDRTWRIIFPFYDCWEPANDCHKVYLFDGVHPRSLARPGTELVFTPSNDAVSYGQEASYSSVINMNDAAFHDQMLRKQNDWQERGVLVKIKEASFRARVSRSEYQFYDKDSSPVFAAPRLIGYNIHAEVIAQSMTVSLNGQPIADPFTQNKHFLIDNDCRDLKPMSHPADLRMMYCLFTHQNEAARRYSVQRRREHLPSPPTLQIDDGYNQGLDGFWYEVPDAYQIQMKESSDPAPGEYGLPCHAVNLDPPPPNLP